jgi:hypothetical protein
VSGFISPGGASIPFKTAFCFVASGGSLVAGGSLNVDSVTALGVGNYVVDFTSAGFTANPQVFWQLMSDSGSDFRYEYLVAVDQTTAEIQIYDDTNAPVDNRVRFFAIGV